ncbi:MAG: DsbA family oxidoreductase [Paludibacterium sp.]|uniref:DsbA family oxidoreductase n=1 Tax=Paludibacterium sp. TaxID=1917523 RepID=UPI0025CFFAAE|nr:DsbA family oxidoreductase [Paludibacterium sp.]MBV8048261.1 DsbA family oxidoreductase [Paludibacterium sp.]
MSRKPISVTITSDFICPWCFIAERRLNKEAEDLGVTLDLSYQPYELNPDMPKAGVNRKEYRSRKFGNWEHSQKLDAKTIEAAQADPLTFNYEKIEVTPNTLGAHRLINFVQRVAPDKAAIVADLIFEGYFSKGLDIGSTDSLVKIAAAAGLNADAVLAHLQSDDGADDVANLEREAMLAGIRGVPFLVIGGQSLPGAASAETMRALLLAASSPDQEH